MKKIMLVYFGVLALCLPLIGFAVDSIQITGSEIFVASPDSIPMLVTHNSGHLAEGVMPESTLYFTIDNARRADDFANIRALSDDFERGSEFVGKPTIEYRLMYDENGNELGYRYVLALPVLGLAGEERAFVNGKVAVAKSWYAAKKFKFGFVIRNSGVATTSTYLCEPLEFVVEFPKKSNVVNLVFDDRAVFEVNGSGQGALDVGFHQYEITDIRLRYPTQKLEFLTFVQTPVFNRKGKLYLNAKPGTYLYEITPNGLAEITDYDDIKKRFFIETRRLSSYVISDLPLSKTATMTARENPQTGNLI